MNRQQMLQRLQDSSEPWDLLVIGGGATGLGVAWNASASGYRTLLLESDDFAQGTSSRSTKLIHGGVRYLRQGQIGMVRSALQEREFLLQSAPSLVWPLNLVIPSYHFGSRLYYFAGLKLYDLLAGKRNMQPARLLSSEKTSSLLPTLKTSGLKGGVAFCDGQFDDARLAICIAQTIAADDRSVLLNYSPVLSIDRESNSKLRVVRFRDQLTGEEREVTARVVVNATGVFAEQVCRIESQGSDLSQPIRVLPSRGSHIVLPGSFLQGPNALMIPNTDDGRVLFAIPWLGHTLVGTTDVATNSIDREPLATGEEVDYLLDHAGRYFTVGPKRQDVLSVFSGLRPLLGSASSGSTGSAASNSRKSTNGQSPKVSTAKLSREHEIVVSRNGLVSIIGGKWTTFRKMGLDVLKIAVEVAGLPKHSYQSPTINWSRIQPATPYQSDLQPLDDRLPICRADIQRAVREEMAEKLEDVLARRTRCLLLNSLATQEIAQQVVEVMRQELGQDSTWARQQRDEFKVLASKYQIEHCRH